MSHTTIQELIQHLQTIENKGQPVVFQYYLAEHFHESLENFARVSAELDGILPAYAENYELISNLLEGVNNGN